MEAVFSVLFSARLIAQRILTWGEAASLSALRSFTRDYWISPQFISPPGEDSEAREVFSDVNPDLDVPEILSTKTCNPSSSQVSHLKMQRDSGSLQHTAIQTEEQTKRLYIIAVNEARKLARRSRRRFDLYGPPDWEDPALSILPNIGFLQESCCRSVIPSPYPFLAPHILVSQALVPDAYPAFAWTNSLQCQDHDYGNRLIVAQAPSMGGPLPLVINPGPRTEYATLKQAAPVGTCSAAPASDVPALECDSDDESSSGSSERSTVGDSPDRYLLPNDKDSETYTPAASWLPVSTFWIEEDDDDLPELPGDW